MTATVPNLLVVPVSGDLCIAELPALRARLDEVIDAGHLHLALDLSQCTLLTAAALRAIEATERRLQGLGGSLRLLDPQPLPAQVLAITGFDRLL